MRCEDIGFGTYDCAYNIMVPWLCKLPNEPESARKPKYIAVDKCLLPEEDEDEEGGHADEALE